MVIFVSGVHGSGKGFFCDRLSSELSIPHFSASEVLKWEEVSTSLKNKKVINISDTQNRLLVGLEEIKLTHASFILDGHCCLLDSVGKVQKVDLSIFTIIAPNFIIYVNSNSKEIQRRLKERDDIEYPLILLERMQKMEMKYSEYIANQLNVSYIQYDGTNLNQIIKNLI